MKISVITVTWNSAATVADTLRSVNAQTHPDIEHIVVDGGSTDGTLEIVKAEGKRVAALVSERDNGIYDAMNKGLRLATGELVGFLNGDDTFASSETIATIARAASTSQSDALFGDLVYVNPALARPLVRYWRAGKFSRGKLRLGWMPPHPTLYVRRETFERVGAFDAGLRIAADYEFMLRLFRRHDVKVTYIAQVLVNMRVGGASNASIAAMFRKSREDLLALRRNRAGGLLTLMCKNVRKLPQFFSRPAK